MNTDWLKGLVDQLATTILDTNCLARCYLICYFQSVIYRGTLLLNKITLIAYKTKLKRIESVAFK